MKDKIWKKCVEFHGHECGGLTIGYKAALYAIELLEIKTEDGLCVSEDEQIVCISENDACGVPLSSGKRMGRLGIYNPASFLNPCILLVMKE